MKFLILFLLFVSCAKKEQENLLLFLQKPDTSEIVVEIIPEIKEEEEIKDTIPEVIQEEIKLEKIEKKKVVVKKPQEKKSEPVEEEAKFIFDDKFYPKTREEARIFAFECYKLAKEISNIDSVKIIAQKGLSIYENASLYYYSAKSFAAAGNYSRATNLCKTAISRNDFWGDEKNKTLELLVNCLQFTYEKTPSSLLLSEINKYKELLK